MAVANYEIDKYSYNGDSGNIAIYKKGEGKPALYGQNLGRFTSVAYDDHGDLLATDQNYYYYSFYDQIEFGYLPNKSKTLLSITLPNPNACWAGRTWRALATTAPTGWWRATTTCTAIRSTSRRSLYDTLELSGAYSYARGIALYRKTSKAQAVQVVAGGEGSGPNNPIAGALKGDFAAPQGIAVDQPGNVYVTNLNGQSVFVYAKGSKSPTLVHNNYFPVHVTVASDGTI